MINRIMFWALSAFSMLTVSVVNAEPYLSVKSGLQCSVCHVSPSGGGMRTVFGQSYGKTLAQDQSTLSQVSSSIANHLRIGVDMRTSLKINKQQGQDIQTQFQSDRTSLYLNATIIPQKINLYIDQQLAPASINRTAWMKYTSEDLSWYVRAGKFFLPYGLRLEDDSAFIRQVTGINFAAADNGIEWGFTLNQLFTQLAISNGTQGAAEIDNDKQFSIRSVYTAPNWRLGSSYNTNQANGTTRTMFNIFSAFKWLNSEFLFEIDDISDNTDSIDTKQLVFFGETNTEITKGHNIKYSYEYHDYNTSVDEDQRIRHSLVWEFTPYQQVQIRTGLRVSQGIPQKDQDNYNELFSNVHVWF